LFNCKFITILSFFSVKYKLPINKGNYIFLTNNSDFFSAITSLYNKLIIQSLYLIDKINWQMYALLFRLYNSQPLLHFSLKWEVITCNSTCSTAETLPANQNLEKQQMAVQRSICFLNGSMQRHTKSCWSLVFTHCRLYFLSSEWNATLASGTGEAAQNVCKETRSILICNLFDTISSNITLFYDKRQML